MSALACTQAQDPSANPTKPSDSGHAPGDAIATPTQTAKPASVVPSVNAPALACLHEGPGCAQEAPPTDQKNGHFGDAFKLAKADPLGNTLQTLTNVPEGQASDVVQVQGEIGPVCQKKGCWMMLQDGGSAVRVIMARGAFSVPRDGKGKRAIVEGTLKARVLSAAQVEHLAADEGKVPAPAQSQREYVLTATAVEVL